MFLYFFRINIGHKRNNRKKMKSSQKIGDFFMKKQMIKEDNREGKTEQQPSGSTVCV